MNRQTATALIKDTFNYPFDEGRFRIFTVNLLNELDERKSFDYLTGNYIKDSFKTHVAKYRRLGTYTDPDGEKVDVLVVQLRNEWALERSRTMLRNFVADYLKNRDKKDAALVAYYTTNLDDWRFSFIRMEYKLEETESGKIKVKEELTPAKRYSFLVGKNEPNHTAQEQLVGILENDEYAPTLDAIEKSFDIETVTKEFFLKYRELFLRTKEELDRVVKKYPKIEADFETKGVDTVNFAKKLLGQIVFLYFLQKKGWFGVSRDNDWGTGSKHFLRELFEKKHGDYKNFFNDILEPLFYEALRIDRSHDDGYYSRFDCKIPFLNGGLFDPIGNYDWVRTDILIPDKLFSNTRKTKEGDTGDGILDIFDRFNFTVKEDEPLEKEVAIDPELLGKAYEKFNAIRPDNYNEFRKALKSGKKGEENKFNKKFGVYYTPREIVHYMCQQSLINYLYTQINKGAISYQKIGDIQTDMLGNKPNIGQLNLTGKHRPNSQISKADIEALIHIGEQVSENEVAALIKEQNIKEGKQKTSGYKLQLSESIRSNAALIDEKLADITVCDPAVGSGAFPVGMMSEIVKARNVLSVFLNDNSRTTYEFKRRCIEHSLYGVDIDPGAVEIAKLRLWLSLMVDEEDIKNIKPLPNLDYKIVCGNSLLGVEKDLFNANLFSELEELKPLFFNETNPTNKQKYKTQIDKLISEITNGHTEFDFEVYFSEVFHEQASPEHSRRGGFDVVIANPPYVRADSGPEYLTFRKKLVELKTFQTLYEKWDLMVPFIERGLTISNKKGDLIYIVSNAICTSKYAYKLLDLVQEKYFTHSIDFFEKMDVFEAGVIPVVLHIGKTEADGKTTKIIRRLSFEKISNKTEIPTNEFKSLGRDAFRKIYNPIIIKKRTVMLGDTCYISYGLRPNSDERYWKGEFTAKDIIRESKDKKYSQPYVEGKNLGNYFIDRVRYLEWGTARVPKKLVRPTFPELYNRPKIMRGILTGGTFDVNGIICNHSIVVFVSFSELHGVNNKSILTSIKKFNHLPRTQLEKISENFDLKYLLSVLNSSFAFKYLNDIRRHRLENYFYPYDFRRLPIVDITPKEQKPFVVLVDKILTITKDDDYLQNQQKQAKVKTLEAEIDQLVYALYGMTEEEIQLVEESVR